MQKTLLGMCLLAVSSTQVWGGDAALYQKLQDVSVTVKAGGSEGSGVIITREVPVGDTKEKINFVWTAAHVVARLRSVRNTIEGGMPKKIVEFKDAQIVKELVENGRRVGEIKMDAKVVKYSDADSGEDLALLLVRKRNFVDQNISFYPHDTPIPVGTELYHVGSLLGQVGSNSMTRGIMSKVGRVLELGTGDGVVFDQTSAPAFPGSSGGGIFLTEASAENAGRYAGMLVRGAGETFNLIVPIRRMRKWARTQNILWAVDETLTVPSYETILKMPSEHKGSDKSTPPSSNKDSKRFPVLLPPTTEEKKWQSKPILLEERSSESKKVSTKDSKPFPDMFENWSQTPPTKPTQHLPPISINISGSYHICPVWETSNISNDSYHDLLRTKNAQHHSELLYK